MQCYKPVYLKDAGFYVPCGGCINCRIARTRDWAVRCLHETGNHQDSVFVTLTYSDDFMPKTGSINKGDFVEWIREFRRLLYPRKIKYFASGEYGTKTMRPHYHAILFGVSFNDFQIKYINGKTYYSHDTWPFGHIYLGDVNYKTARYTAKYIFKKYNGDLAREVYTAHGLEVPFQLQSQGIGKQYALDNKERLKHYLYLTVNGEKVSIPRYYRKIIGITDEDYKEHLKKMELRSEAFHGKKYHIYYDKVDVSIDYERNLALSRLQAERNAKAKDKAYNKDSKNRI